MMSLEIGFKKKIEIRKSLAYKSHHWKKILWIGGTEVSFLRQRQVGKPKGE